MSSSGRYPNERQGHGNSHHRSNTTRHGASSSSGYYTNPNQSAGGTTPPIGWSSPPSSAAQGPGAAYPQGGRSPQYGGLYRSDSGAYPIRQQGNASPNVLQDESLAWFLSIDQDGDRRLTSDELRSALLNNRGLRFSDTTVKYLMSIFDRDRNGVITYDEFEPLWMYITDWRQMFDSFDGDRDGRIDATELGRALNHYHIRVGPHILDMLVKKYGIIPSRNRLPGYGNAQVQVPRPQMELDQFICASVVVQEMCNLYKRCNAGGPPQISRDEFLEAVISLP